MEDFTQKYPLVLLGSMKLSGLEQYHYVRCIWPQFEPRPFLPLFCAGFNFPEKVLKNENISWKEN